MKRISFSSDNLPAELSDRARFKLWHEIHNANIGSLDYTAAEDWPFYARVEAIAVGQIALGSMACSIQRAERGTTNIAENDVGGHNLFVNAGARPIGGTQGGREFVLDPGEAVLMSNTEPLQFYGGGDNAWMSIVLPDRTLSKAFPHPDNYTSRRVGADNEALSLLKRYRCFLRDGAPEMSPGLLAHAEDTIVDLVALTLGMKGPESNTADLPGLRGARLVSITESIRQRFREPDISAQLIAKAFGLSARYVHDLLQETGLGFGERVMELRLQETCAMLTSANHRHLRISEVALLCGFSDISHFNRCFRRRFGCTPTAAR